MTEKIKKISDFQHARLRTEMWLGSRDPHTQTVLEYEDGVPVAKETTWVPALFTAIREVVDNAIDEVITHKQGNRIDVTYDPATLTFVVQDNGRGIPIGFDKVNKQYEATMALTETKAGRNFEDDRGATRGLNGVGGSIVNFCSEWLQMDIRREGMHFSQRFSEGEGGKNANLIIDSPMILPLKAKEAKITGTRIEFRLSPKVFHKLILPESFVKSRVFEVALCYPQAQIFYNGERMANSANLKKNGIEQVLFAGHSPISVTIEEPGFSSRFWLIPEFFNKDSDGSLSEFNHSLVNAIPTFNGGIHIETFRKGFFGGMLTALEKESKKRGLTPNRGDLSDGMLLYNITEMDNPSFDSQSKTRLLNENVGAIIRRALNDEDFFKNTIKKNPEWIKNVYERCAERTQKKDDLETVKLAKKNSRTKVLGLRDAVSTARSKCILLLTEGDSAKGGINEARNPEIHGVLPLRGKVLNVRGLTNKEILLNEVLSKVMSSIGLTPGQKAIRHHLRYGKVYLAVDADEDGKSIASLLVNFFFYCWPELFDPEREPFIYLFDTPLIIAVKGKVRKYWYADNDHEFIPDNHKGWEISRAKGLALLKSADWEWILEHIKSRPITDDGKLGEALNLIFNKKLADARKDWIGL